MWGLFLLSIGRPLSALQVPPRPVSPTQPVATPTSEIAPPRAPAARGLRDRAEIEAFMDGVMTAQLRDHHIAGATVAVVTDGELFCAQVCGTTEVVGQIPVQRA